jgi:hypothetical protein
MVAEKASGLLLRLQFRLLDVEVHAIDAFDFQGHVATDDIGNAARYTHDWLRSTKVLTTTTASSGSIMEAAQADLADRPELFLLTTPRRSEAEPR